MRRFNRTLAVALSVLLSLSMLLQPALAAEDTYASALREHFQLNTAEIMTVSESVYHAIHTAAAAASFSMSKNGIAFIIQYEGFDEHPYWDYGQWTVGYGTNYVVLQKLYPDLFPNNLNGYSAENLALAKTITVTKEQAEAALAEEIRSHANSVNNYLRQYNVQVNQNQFDALVSLTYNVGPVWITYKNDDGTNCLLRRLLEGSAPSTWTYDRVEAAFIVWRTAGGQVLEGLERRRRAEAKLFVTPYIARTPIGPFTDVYVDDWYADAVQGAYERRIMVGGGDGTFNPMGNLTRAEMVQTIANMMSVDLTKYRWEVYSDVLLSEWYAPAVAWADREGIVRGVGDGLFAPKANIDRQQVCVMLANYLKSLDIKEGSINLSFSDAALVQDYAREGVRYCVSLGLMSGTDTGAFEPNRSITRAEIASVMVRTAALLEANGILKR